MDNTTDQLLTKILHHLNMVTTLKMFLSVPNTGVDVIHVSMLDLQYAMMVPPVVSNSSTLVPNVPAFHSTTTWDYVLQMMLMGIVIEHTTTYYNSMFNLPIEVTPVCFILLAYQMYHSRLTFVIMSQGPLEFRTQDYLQNICNPPVPPKNGHLLLHIIVGLMNCNTSKMRRHHSIPRKHHKMYSRTPHYVQTFDDICKMCFH